MKSQHIWIVGVLIAFLAGGFLIGKNELSTLLPYVFVLICPLMMVFMMGGHKHK